MVDEGIFTSGEQNFVYFSDVSMTGSLIVG